MSAQSSLANGAACRPLDKISRPAAQSKKTIAREAGFTGKTAADAGQRAKTKIKAIDEARRQSFEEFNQ